MARGSALAVVICWTCLLGACNGDQPQVDPGQRDINSLLGGVSEIVYQCRAAAAGQVANIDVSSVERDVDLLVNAWTRLRPDASFRTATGTNTLRQLARIALRRLEDGCAPKEAARLRKALEE